MALTKINYDPPTTNEDGSPLALTDIAKFQVGYGTTSENYTNIKDDASFEVGRQATLLSVFGTLPFGTLYFATRTVSKNGQTSKWSAEYTAVNPAPTPNPPSNLSVA